MLFAIASKVCPAQAGATLAAGPAHGQGRLSKPGCRRGSGQVIRRSAAPSRPQRSRARTKPFLLPARARAAMESIAAVRLRFRQFVSLQRQNAGEFRNRTGEGFSIAQRFISAVSLLVYKVKQFEGNYLQCVATQELPEKSSAYEARPGLGRLTSTWGAPLG